MKGLRTWTGKRVGQLSHEERNKEAQPRSKYRNKRVVAGGLHYDSKAEYRRHQELMLLEHSGEIRDLRFQVPFELVPSVRFIGARRAQPAMRYIADFVYVDKTGRQIIEDVKGCMTREFILKRHLMLALLGLHITIVRMR